jgi:YegS/Rv2252/BmrU family lipid kinase
MIVIYNPNAGRRRVALLWRVLDVLVGNGIRLEIVETTHPRHATELARQAVSAGVKLVVAAGGDGTIAEVTQGLAGSPALLGIIPLGTANVLAHELSLPFAPRECAAALVFGRCQEVWPGVVTANGQAGDQTRLFVQMLGAGFDAQVVHHLPPRLKRMLGRGAYVAQSMREMMRYRFPPLAVTVDGVAMQAGSVIVSKGRLYGGPYLLAPEASPKRPGFSVIVFEHGGVLPAMLYGAALPLNQLWRAPAIRHIRAARVTLEGAYETQMDGDAAPHGPLVIEDAAAPIRVVMG